jgi:hypothetical protein
MPKAQRDAVLARLAAGELDVITNCMVLTEGWDMPAVGCCILARPTRKMGLYRRHRAIVLDHSGAVFRHGFIDDPVTWTLDPDKRDLVGDIVSNWHRYGERRKTVCFEAECKAILGRCTCPAPA